VIFWQYRMLGHLPRIHVPLSAPDRRTLPSPAGPTIVPRPLPQAAAAVSPPRVAFAAGPMPEEARLVQLRVEAERAREKVRNAYGPILRALGLDPVTADQLVGLLAQERLTAKDALVAAQAQGINSPSGYKAAVEEALGHDDEQIVALLDPADFAQFDAYRRTLPEQQTVAQLAARLTGSATPLGDGQQAQLVQLINQLEPPTVRDNQAFLSVIGMDEAPLTPAMVSTARSILSAPQASAFSDLAAAWLEKAQLQQALRPRGAASPGLPSP
jgi:hypothetical protein